MRARRTDRQVARARRARRPQSDRDCADEQHARGPDELGAHPESSCGDPRRRARGAARLGDERRERGEPARAIAVRLPLEPRAQLGEPARHAFARRGRRRTRARGDGAMIEPFEVAQEHRGAQRLVEREHGLDDAAVDVGTFDDLVGGRRAVVASRVVLVCRSLRCAPRGDAGEVAQDACEPRAQDRFGARAVRRAGDGGEQRLLRDVVRAIRVADERAGQRSDPAGLRDQELGVEPGGRRRHRGRVSRGRRV